VNDPLALLDSDTLSELSRGRPSVVRRARAYLEHHGRFTVSAITVFERLRGYRAALALGKPFEPQLRAFEALTRLCVVLPVDVQVADVAANLWASLGTRARRSLGDILIAATASAHGLPLVTRNRRDFEPMGKVPGMNILLVDWSR
jgi:predicted nucleic acid-binding protein